MKSPTLAKSLLTLSAFTGAAALSHATILVNDNFDYGSSSLDSGYGSWQDGSGNIAYQPTDNRITSWSGDSSYVFGTAGGSLQVGASAAYRGAQLNFSSAISGEIWVSALMQERTNAVSDAGIMLAFDNDGSWSSGSFSSFGFGISGNGNLWTTSSSASAPDEVAGPVGLSSGYNLFVAKLTVNGSGATDSISIWAFPNSTGGTDFDLTEVSLGTAIYTDSSVQLGDDIEGVWFGGRKGADQNGQGNLDNLRISTSLGDAGVADVIAVPEPSTYAALLGLLALGFVAYRRRR